MCSLYAVTKGQQAIRMGAGEKHIGIARMRIGKMPNIYGTVA